MILSAGHPQALPAKAYAGRRERVDRGANGGSDAGRREEPRASTRCLGADQWRLARSEPWSPIDSLARLKRTMACGPARQHGLGDSHGGRSLLASRPHLGRRRCEELLPGLPVRPCNAAHHRRAAASWTVRVRRQCHHRPEHRHGRCRHRRLTWRATVGPRADSAVAGRGRPRRRQLTWATAGRASGPTRG